MSIDVSIHRVTKIELSDIRTNERGHGHYDVRDIVITHDDGQVTTITLFGKDTEDSDNSFLRVFA